MRTAKQGTVFYYADQGTEVLFLLKSGKVKLYHELPDGKRLTFAIVEQGTFFGDMSLLGQRLLGTCAVALDGAVVGALGRRAVRSLFLEHPTVALRTIEVLSRRLQEKAFNDLTGREASLLLRPTGEDADAIEGFSHGELAAMVGCLRESFAATLDRFKPSQAVAIGRRRIEIIDRGQRARVVNQRYGCSA